MTTRDFAMFDPNGPHLGTELDWKPTVLRASAWLQHVPFAYWVVNASRPKCIVELGTHTGVSYFAFCQAVQRLGLSTKCFAVDTWKGDEHAGEYGEQVFNDVTSVNNSTYQAFSYLLRSTFDDARSYFADGEIDLLHIDGLHTYEAVAHDFSTWRPKLSKHAIVIFHDINVRERDFGVWRLWKQLQDEFPYFEFHHGYGLGILGIGTQLPPDVKSLVEIVDSDRRGDEIRATFAARGESVSNLYQMDQLARQVGLLSNRDAGPKSEIKKLDELISLHNSEINAVRASANVEMEIQLKRMESKHMEAIANLERRLKSTHMEAIIDLEQKFAADMRAATDSQKNKLETLKSRNWMIRKPTARKLTGVLRQVGLQFSRRSTEARLVPTVVPLREESQGSSNVASKNISSTLLSFQESLIGDTKSASIIWVGGEPDTPGYRYRVIYPAAAARVAGKNVTYFRIDELDAHAELLKNADVVILWRAAWDSRVKKLVDIVRGGNARLVFDVDDLMFDPALATFDIIDGIRSQSLTEKAVAEFYQRVQQTMLAADVCMATTEELAVHFRSWGKTSFVIPNGFDSTTLQVSRLAYRRRISEKSDGLFRIGYAAGSKTHQRDFSICASALARILRDFPNARLVLFRLGQHNQPCVDLSEYPALQASSNQVEWRELVPLVDLPNELARFDINLAPLEVGNAFCEAKSELKYFEAALVGVCTVASATGPYRRAIEHGVTGLLASNETSWYEAFERLINSADERKAMAQRALHDVLWTFGPERRAELVSSMLDQCIGGRLAAKAFALDINLASQHGRRPVIPESDVVFEHDRLMPSDVTVIIPLHNYERYIVEALHSVAKQTERDLDLIIVDDASADTSLEKALAWAIKNKNRFNRLLVLKNRINSKLGPTRNVGFAAAETPYVIPLDADNRLLPDCVKHCLYVMRETGAAYVYPTIQQFGGTSDLLTAGRYDALRFAGGNYIDAMALISKSVWSGLGGYENIPHGWEDFDLWCRIAEAGLRGAPAGDVPLAEYRVHEASMLRTQTHKPGNYESMLSHLRRNHPWLAIQEPKRVVPSDDQALKNGPLTTAHDRLSTFLEILRCPITGLPLERINEGELRTVDGAHIWPIVGGRPLLFPELPAPEVRPPDHISNVPPEEVMQMMRSAKGLVLHISAGGTPERLEHVIEAEVSLFRNTDVVADAHRLPFADASFEGIVTLNAFEHYMNPSIAASEFLRVLKPGGWLFVRTAFLQPLHEAPWHFYNCTKFGLLKWFEGFDTDRIQVSDNFNPSYTISWIAAEAEQALRRDVSDKAADAFKREPIGTLVKYWREESSRDSPVWQSFQRLSQGTQEGLAAGFEYIGRKPIA